MHCVANRFFRTLSLLFRRLQRFFTNLDETYSTINRPQQGRMSLCLSTSMSNMSSKKFLKRADHGFKSRPITNPSFPMLHWRTTGSSFGMLHWRPTGPYHPRSSDLVSCYHRHTASRNKHPSIEGMSHWWTPEKDYWLRKLVWLLQIRSANPTSARSSHQNYDPGLSCKLYFTQP